MALATFFLGFRERERKGEKETSIFVVSLIYAFIG